ncbi:MAG: hypothetical protein ACYTEQ_18445 [Planctomycetota bacterium]|jgi:hypothetical protein
MENKNVRSTIKLDANLHRQARVFALETGRSFGSVVNEALKKLLKSEERKKRREEHERQR